jgi:hypothetical protein|tara:strand:- start:797 stop:1177 length:381 start_codon:yes stop_codon:yes gene_type:complete
MKRIILSVCMLIFSANCYSSFNTLKVDLDSTHGFKEIESLLPVELSSYKKVEIESDYLDISKKYSMTDQARQTFIVRHPNKNAQTTLLVKYNTGEVTKLKINFVSNNDVASCDFKLTYGTTVNCDM